jgi:hypothetical protein
MKKQKQHEKKDTNPETLLELAVLAQALLEGKDVPVRLPHNTPKWQLLAAMLLMYTNSVTNYNVKHLKGFSAPEPPELATVMHATIRRAEGDKTAGEPTSLLRLLNRISPLFRYQGDWLLG